MLETPTAAREPLSQFNDADGQLQFMHELTSQQVLQPMDSVAGQYDGLGSDFMTQPSTAFDCSLAESEMAVAGTDVDVSDFGFPSVDVNMAEDGMAMPSLLSLSTLFN